MGNPNGNPGNKGGTGRPSVKETIWHKEQWEIDSMVEELEKKIASKKYAIRDVWLLKALKGDGVILKQAADKILASLMDVTTNGKDLTVNNEAKLKSDVAIDDFLNQDKSDTSV